jgi:outer membrane receptor protein involved in Fe transport
LAFFGNVQGDLSDRLAVAAGIRYDYNYSAGEAGGFGHLFTPRLAVILQPHEDHNVKLIQSHSFQAPSAWATYSSVTNTRVANTALKPEKLNSFEAIWTYTPTSRLRSTLSGYYTQIENSIVLVRLFPTDPVNKVAQHQNSGGYTVFGGEWETRFQLALDKSIYLNASSALTKDRVTGRKIGDIAQLKANFGTDLVFASRWGLSFRGHYVSQRDTLNWLATPGTQLFNYSQKSVDAYLTADLTLSLLEAFKGLAFRINLYNLGNKSYYDPGPRTGDGLSYNSAILQEGFRAFLGLDYRF